MDTVRSVPRSSQQPDGQSVADQLIDDLERACPAHRRGTRPIHAPGIAVTGWFQASSVASSFSSAAHFSGAPVPVTVRFSNGTGDADEADGGPLVRGMATKFHLGAVWRDEWGVQRSDLETDVVAMTLPVFFTNSVDRFREFVVAATPAPPRGVPRWRRLLETLRLETPYPSPPAGIPSAEQGTFDFADSYPPAAAAVAMLATKFVPESYTTSSYHAVHAFRLTAPDGTTRSVRFRWEPVAGVQTAPAGAQGNFLREGLEDWIGTGRAELVLRIQVAEQGDDTSNPMRPWPSRRPLVVMGQLRLTEVVQDQYHGCELLSFNPTRLVPGIGLSDDPTLALRGEVYDRSATRRLEATAAAPSANPG